MGQNVPEMEEAPGKPQAPEESTAMDVSLFQAKGYSQRTCDISVPGLAIYYPENVRPVIKVKNLEGAEIAAIDVEVMLNKEARSQIIGIANDDMIKALKTIFHFTNGEDIPDAHVRALNIVHKGIAEPSMPFDGVVKLAKTHPVEFKQLFNKITELTGLGALPEK